MTGEVTCDRRPIRIQESKPGFFEMFGEGRVEITARVCTNCRHVDLFAPDLDTS